MSKMNFVNEPVMIVNSDGDVEPYIPIEIKTNRDAYSASLDMIFKHVAEFHVTIVQIIADKYGLDVNDIMSEVRNDDRYQSITNVTNGMGYVNNDPPVVEKTEEEQPKPRKVVKRRVTATISVDDPANTEDETLNNEMNKMAIDAPPPVKKRVYKKKTAEA